MGRLLLLIEKKRAELHEAMDVYGIRDSRVLAISQELDKIISVEQKMMLWLSYTNYLSENVR